MTRLAVTGANGFVGRQLVALAASQGIEVVGAVRSAAGAEAVRRAGGRPARVPGLEPGPLAEAFAGAAAVVHLAQIGAEVAGASYAGVNVAGTRAVAAAAAAARAPRVAFLSGLGVARFGLARRCTNAYFLSKLAAEVELFGSGLEVAVLRPSYIVGPGDAVVPELLAQLATGEVELAGDGAYRMQPIAVKDAAAALLESALGPAPERWRVFDLVGPEAVTYRGLVERLAARARVRGGPAEVRFRERPEQEAERLAAGGGFHGMRSDELDCLLCDEVSDPRPLEALLGRFLTPLDQALDAALRQALPAPPPPG
jgi:nucleoside-diphosphate-sugar epimerase